LVAVFVVATIVAWRLTASGFPQYLEAVLIK
jgi:hypothetical protein